MTSFERILGRTLGVGVAFATALLAIGLTLALASPGHVADVLLQAGLVVLMATPMARVLITCVEYIRERDWFFAINALGVLAVLGITIWHAWRR